MNKTAIALAVLAVCAAVVLPALANPIAWTFGRVDASNDTADTTEPSTPEEPTMAEPTPSREDVNQTAFLNMIAVAEGTAGRGDDGYNVLFGGKLFQGYADHPRIAAQFVNRAGQRLWTSAAGRYQFMAVSRIPTGGSTKVDTWDQLKRRLNLPDFSPASQDRAAVRLLQDAGALHLVRAGRFNEAVAKAAATWASLPGAGYNQPERSMQAIRMAYSDSGGTFA